jgi:V8-like Glu-specific endopeptidase
MPYMRVPEESGSLGYFGCGPGCTCAPCGGGGAQLGQWYVAEEEDGPAPVPRPAEVGRTAGLGAYSYAAPTGWRLGSYVGQSPPGVRTRRVAQAPGASSGVSSAMRAVTDTTQVPFRWVCRVEAITEKQTQRGHSFGTGVLISPWHVLTCAHVIYPPQELYRTVRVVVSPGYSPTSRIVTWARQPAFEADGWAVDPRWNPRECVTSIHFDWGLIRLAKPVGSYIGARQVKTGGYVSTDNWRNWVPLSLAPSLPGMPCKLAGYRATQMFQSDGRFGPSVKITVCRPEETSPSGGIVRSHTEGVTVPVNQDSILITHDADSSESMSGGPIWVDDGGSPKLVAIHSGVTSTGVAGTGAMGAGRVKRAVLLSQAVQYQIQQLMNGSLRPPPPPLLWRDTGA